jgi:hypothetical protein
MTDPDLPSKLRALYVETGANYVQAAADEIERLRAEVARLRGETRKPKGCGRTVAPGQYWVLCGERQMGEGIGPLCTECGGELRLKEQR